MSSIRRGTSRARMTRRRFLASTAAAGSAATWPLILTPGLAKASRKLVIALWGGNYQEAMEAAFLKPFSKETGIEVVVAGAPDMAKVRAMTKSKSRSQKLRFMSKGLAGSSGAA